MGSVTIDPTPDVRLRGSEMRLMVRLVAMVSASMLTIAAVTAFVIAISHRPDWWRGWSAALLVSLVAALLALGPVAVGLFIISSAQSVAFGYLAGAFVRMLVSICGALAAVWVFRTPPVPTLLFMLPLFAAGLVAECFGLSRALNCRKI